MDDPLDQHWRMEALCSLHPEPELWDQSVGENERPPSRNARHKAAIEVCNHGAPDGGPCPVKAECLAAVDRELDEGVRGGRVLPALRVAGYGAVQGVVRKRKAG